MYFSKIIIMYFKVKVINQKVIHSADRNCLVDAIDNIFGHCSKW